MRVQNESTKRIIAPGKMSREYFKEVWRHRELFYFLAWRDFLVRYKQTTIGLGWAVLKPLITILAFTFVFGKLAKLPSEGIPYPLLVFSGLLPWSIFSTTLSHSSDSVVSNTNLITKVYFPRIIIPASSLLVILTEFLISFLIFIILMFWFGFAPDWRIVFLPFYLFLVVIFSFSCVLCLSALNVKFRDIRYVVPFALQFGLYISPVGFTSTLVPADGRLFFSLNPMVGIIDGFRWTLLRNEQVFYWPAQFMSVGLITILLFTSLRYFRRVERSFADFL